MGCCSSNFTSDKLNTTIDGYYAPSRARSASKRSFSSRISTDSSSGVFSQCTTPSRRSILSRCTSPNQQTPSPKPKPNNFNYQNVIKADTPKDFAMMSICDDFCENDTQQNHQQKQSQYSDNDLDKSYGYFSETMSGGSSSTDSPSTTCDTPTKPTSLHRTQDISMCSVTKTTSDLEMEMYMMTHSNSIMPKSSTPVFLRREMTFVVSPQQRAQSYQKWCNYLQTTPAYLLHNITNIPEAVAGHFSPQDFPAFTDIADMENAAKRFKVDTYADEESMYLQPATFFGQTQIIATDL